MFGAEKIAQFFSQIWVFGEFEHRRSNDFRLVVFLRNGDHGNAVPVLNGEAVTTFRSTTETGKVTVQGVYGDTLIATTHVQCVSIAPYQISVINETISLLADGISSDSIRVQVKDRLGNLLSGVTVDFSIESGTISKSGIVTSATGEGAILLTSKASTSDIATKLIATSGGSSDTLNVSYRGITFSLKAQPKSIVANERSTSQITAGLFETTKGTLLDGGTVNFQTTKGNILSSTGTVVNGITSTVLRSTQETGTAQVTGLYGNSLVANVTVELTPSVPGQIILTSDTTSISVKGSGGKEIANITALVPMLMEIPLLTVPMLCLRQT